MDCSPPVSTRRRFNVDTTMIGRQQHCVLTGTRHILSKKFFLLFPKPRVLVLTKRKKTEKNPFTTYLDIVTDSRVHHCGVLQRFRTSNLMFPIIFFLKLFLCTKLDSTINYKNKLRHCNILLYDTGVMRFIYSVSTERNVLSNRQQIMHV